MRRPLGVAALVLLLLTGCGGGGGGGGNRLTIIKREAGGATVPITQITLEVGQKWQFLAELRDAQGNLLSDPLVWSLSGSIGTLDNTGLLDAQQVGEGTVTVQGGGKQASARVVVVAEVGLVLVQPEQVSVETQGTVQFQVEAQDVEGNPLAGIAPLWEVGGNIGSINAQGLFTAGATPGTGIVKVTVGSLSATASVVVTGEVESLRVEPARAEVEVEGSRRLYAVAKDAAGNELQVAAAWSLNPPGLGSITADGLFQAGTQTGVVTAKAQVGSLSATAQITIVPRSTPPPTPGNVFGIVRLQGSTDFSGTTVTVLPAAGGGPLATARTGADGAFGFWLEVGEYRLTFEQAHYQPQEKGVQVQFTNQVVRIEVELSPLP